MAEASADVAEVDLAVIGAGLAGCSLIGRLQQLGSDLKIALIEAGRCLLYTSPSPRDAHESRMPSSA